ncbi:hypothetical protein HN954_00875 [bacterium]|jgi:hypothetical protein|nr:hypothetical protein [bacterium]MBT6831877.1 hypothetical protein [bacterium]MBT6995967.1 hypothetical protein [bacterium]MBT7772242.1 hypothetical protein [bacterium]
MKKITLFLRIVVPSIFLFCSFGMVHAAAYTHSPSTIVNKNIGGSLSTRDFNMIRTTLDNFYYDNDNKLLGIGATDPMVALDVAGGVRIRDFSTAGFVKNDEDGDLSGGNSLTGADLTGFSEGGVTFGDADGSLAQDTPVFYWDKSSDELGIGTSNPTAKLSISSSGANPTINNPTVGNGLILSAAGGSTTGQLRVVANDNGWTDNVSTAYFQIRTLANNNAVFMGGTYGADAPLDRLQFDSEYTTITNNSFESTPVATALFEVVNDTAARDLVQIIGAASQSGDYFQITSNGNSSGNILKVKSSGKVGIGEASPAGTLHVSSPNFPVAVIERTTTFQGGIYASDRALRTNTSGLSNGAGIARYFGLSDNTGTLQHAGSFGVRWIDSTAKTMLMTFNTANGGADPTSGTEQMVIDGTGNVGIGVLDPDADLEVSGSLKINTLSQTLCSSIDHAGKIEYVAVANVGAFYGCLQVDASTFEWVHLEVFGL